MVVSAPRRRPPPGSGHRPAGAASGEDVEDRAARDAAAAALGEVGGAPARNSARHRRLPGSARADGRGGAESPSAARPARRGRRWRAQPASARRRPRRCRRCRRHMIETGLVEMHIQRRHVGNAGHAVVVEAGGQHVARRRIDLARPRRARSRGSARTRPRPDCAPATGAASRPTANAGPSAEHAHVAEPGVDLDLDHLHRTRRAGADRPSCWRRAA